MSIFSVSAESHPELEPSALDSGDVESLSRENLDSCLSSCSSYGSHQKAYITPLYPPQVMRVPSEEDYLQQKNGKANGHLIYSDRATDHSRPWQSENTSDVSIGHYPDLAVDLLPRNRGCSPPPDSEVGGTLCISSCSSLSEDSICTCGDVSEIIQEESEAQSVYDGPLDCMTSLEAALPIRRRSLSRFFFGQSRSFSCLADVMSVKDLAKPENPYARKRKSFTSLSNNVMERPHLSPSRNGAGIKKALHSNKSTLALAAAMSTSEAMLERNELESCSFTKLQNRSTCIRSVSFSNFQRTECQLEFNPPQFFNSYLAV